MSAAAGPETEALVPEADRVGDFPHPRETSSLSGHESAEEAFLKALGSGRLHHAWLLAGPQGIGKATLAYRFARFLLKHGSGPAAGEASSLDVSRDDPVFRQVAALAHPGLLVLRRAWQSRGKRHAQAITVDEARRLRAFFGHTASGGRWRVVIIDSADDLNVSAANAVLKSLEEPPENCVFLLVSATPGRLPVTIRSRCRLLRLQALDDARSREVVLGVHAAAHMPLPDEAVLEQSVALAQGSPGTALRLLAGDGVAIYESVCRLVEQMPDPDYGPAHDLAATVTGARNDERYGLFHAVLSDLLQRLISHVATGRALPRREEAIAARLITTDSLAQWAALWETLQRDKAQGDTLNLDRKALVLDCLFRIDALSRHSQVGGRPSR